MEKVKDKIAGSERKGFVELCRFFFCLLIVMYHVEYTDGQTNTQHWANAFIGVEFFFVLSGFLLSKQASNNPLTAIQYTLKTAKTVVIPFWLMLAVKFLISCIRAKRNFPAVFEALSKSLWEVFFLWDTGLRPEKGMEQFVSGGWYLSALLVVGYFVYYLYVNHKKTFVHFLAPLCILMMLGYIEREYHSIQRQYDTVFGLTTGLLRGFAEMSIGVIVYEIHCYFKNRHFTRFQEILFLAYEVLVLSGTALFAYLNTNVAMDGFFPFLFGSIVFTMFLNRTYIDSIFDKALFRYLGKLSLYVYLSHRWFYAYFLKPFIGGYRMRYRILIELPVLIAGGIVLMLVSNRLKALLKK